MEENLRTLRLIHQILIGLSAALVAFVLSSDPTARYKSALADLDALRRLPLEDYAVFAHEKVAATEADLTTFCEESIRKHTDMLLAESFIVRGPIYPEWPDNGAPLGEHLRFFEGENKVKHLEFACDNALRRLLSKYWKEMRDTGFPHSFRLSEINLKTSEDVPTKTLGDGTLVLLQPPAVGQTRLILQVTFSEEGEAPKASIAIGEPVGLYHIETFDCRSMDWIRSRPEIFRQVVSIVNGKEVLLANLKAFSNEVESLTPSQAAKYLQEKMNSAKRKISLLGIFIEGETAVWVGPFVMLLLFLFFLAHVRHLRVLGDSNHQLLKTFPWIALFDDGLSRFLTFGSVVLLPSLASAALLWRSGQSREVTSILGAILTLASVTCGTLIMLKLNQLRAISSRVGGGEAGTAAEESIASPNTSQL